MNRIVFPSILLVIFILAACTKADEADQKNVGTLTLPVASFYYSGNDSPAPVTVNFINTSQYSDQYEWTFHNGYTTSETNPSFTYYNNTGKEKTFLVTLKVTDTNSGKSDTRSKSILIKPSN